MNVGARITQLRTAHGISQYALWKRSGIAQGALSQYEAGNKTPGVDTLERICEALGIRMSDFFSEEQAVTSAVCLSSKELELIHYYRHLSSSQQEDTLLILRLLSHTSQSQISTNDT